MATRNLTEIFMLMRNNASQDRNIFCEQNITDRMALVEAGDGTDFLRSGLPPVWTTTLEEAQYSISRIRKKIRDLSLMQETHLFKPTLDDSVEQEKRIELLTEEITRVFNSARRLIHQIKQQSVDSKNTREQRLSYNVIAYLVGSLQELSNQFRSSQTSYLNKLKSREERSRLFFTNEDGGNGGELSLFEIQNNSDDINVDKEFELGYRFSEEEQQVMMLEQDFSQVASERRAEIDRIVHSIADLNHLFKDLSYMIADQGSVLDRIDYNIEQTQAQVKQAYQQLAKADQYQRNNRKMQCILILAPATLVLLLLLIMVKF